MDFSRKKTLEPFTADGDTFIPVPGIAAMLVGDIVTRINTAGDLDSKMKVIEEFFNIALTDESAQLMRERLRSKTNPIDVDQSTEIISWMMEEIGQRPTPPSSSSSDGSAAEDTGTSSTVGAANEVLIPTSFLPTAS